MKKTFALSLVAIALLSVVACGKAKDSGSVRGRNGRTAGVSPTGNVQTGSAGAVSANMNEQQFTQLVRSFLSSYVDPADVGTVRPNIDVTVAGAIYYSCATGQVYTQQSKIVITVNDSFVQQGAAPIKMIIPAVSGTVGYTSTLRFQDDLGQVVIQGQTSTSGISGTLSWQNSVNVAGDSGTSGTLGSVNLNASNFYCY